MALDTCSAESAQRRHLADHTNMTRKSSHRQFDIFIPLILFLEVFIPNKCLCRCTFSSFCDGLSQQESRFLGVLQGRQSIWAGHGDAASRHSISIGHQTRPYVSCVGGAEEATVL